MKKIKWISLSIGLAGMFIAGKIIAKRCPDPMDIDDNNEYLNSDDDKSKLNKDKSNKDKLYENKLDYRETEKENFNFYKKYGKRILDNILSFGGLVVLSPLYGIISLAIKIDDPGPVFFTQKRTGKDKHFFLLHKFRSMKMSAPHDVPTHQMADPEQYITRVGKVLRKTSLDELPQIWDIFRGKMSVIGPRPALWNQDDLIAEREKYGANDILPGLTGLAQINGRDELEIVEKAKLDGEYARKQGFFMDAKCFFGTIASVVKSDGVVEGGTGKLHKGFSLSMFKENFITIL